MDYVFDNPEKRIPQLMSAGELCAKCQPAIDEWAPVAQRIWDNENDPRYEIRHNGLAGMDVLDLVKLEKLGRDWVPSS